MSGHPQLIYDRVLSCFSSCLWEMSAWVYARDIVKESLPALICDLFTFSSKVIKSFITEHLNVQKKKRKQSKNSGPDGIRSSDL
jgi:hypothetical protein